MGLQRSQLTSTANLRAGATRALSCPKTLLALLLGATTVGSAFGALAADPPKATAAKAVTAGPPPVVALTVAVTDIDDLKSVYATVRSKDRIEARVRTPGTIASLKVDEGAQVEAGQVLATVADQKFALRLRALDAQILALQSRLSTAKSELERTEQLRQRNVAPQQRLDQAKTGFEVAVNELKAARAEREVLEKQIEEGQVLAPAGGRVLKVPVTVGSVVLAGESLATIAANDYLLRIELPERHARFLKVGDPVKLGARGLSGAAASEVQGRIIQVFPELQNGRVLADAEVPSLGDYFVGERALIYIAAGRRQAIVVPRALVVQRAGLDYVRVLDATGTAHEVPVQLGVAVSGDGGARAASVEILAGLKAGDKVVAP